MGEDGGWALERNGKRGGGAGKKWESKRETETEINREAREIASDWILMSWKLHKVTFS